MSSDDPDDPNAIGRALSRLFEDTLGRLYIEHPAARPHIKRYGRGMVAILSRLKHSDDGANTPAERREASDLTTQDLSDFVAHLIEWAKSSAKRRTPDRERFLLVYYAYYVFKSTKKDIDLRPYLREHVSRSVHRELDNVLEDGLKSVHGSIRTRGRVLADEFRKELSKKLSDEERDRWSPLLQLLAPVGVGGAIIAVGASSAAAATLSTKSDATSAGVQAAKGFHIAAKAWALWRLKLLVSTVLGALAFFAICGPTSHAPEPPRKIAPAVGGDSTPLHGGRIAVTDCEGKRSIERRRCLVKLAEIEQQVGHDAYAVDLYRQAIAVTYQDNECTPEDRQRISGLTIHDPSAFREGYWKFDTADIWDRLSSFLWHAGYRGAAAAAYHNVVDICASLGACEVRQCVLLQLLQVETDQAALAIATGCSGIGNHNYRSAYAYGRAAEALGRDEWALISYARQLHQMAPIDASDVINKPSAALSRWQDVYPLEPRLPIDTYDRYVRALKRIEDHGKGVWQGRVFVFATTGTMGMELWIVTDLPKAIQSSCPSWDVESSGSPSFVFDIVNNYNSLGFLLVNSRSLPIAGTKVELRAGSPRIKLVTRFVVEQSEESGSCSALEDHVDVCIDHDTVRPASACR